MSKRKGTPEGAVVKGCLELLAIHGIMAWRNNTGGVRANYKGRERFVRFGAIGAPDIFAIMRGGRLLGIECKAPKGKATDEQLAFGAMMTRAGAEWEVIRSTDDLLIYLAARGYK